MAKYKNHKSPLLAMMLLGATMAPMVLTSCDDENINPEPFINYVRPIAAESADSLLVAAGLGSTIALMGENLKSIDSIYFNDRKAKISPTFVQNNNIVLSIPTDIPTDITKKIYYYYSGQRKEMDFDAFIPGPLVTNIDRMSIHENGMVYFEGDYFINSEEVPLQCVFASGKVAEIDWEQSTVKRLAVKLPEGAEDGEVKFTSIFGTSSCKFSRTDVLFEGKMPLKWESDGSGKTKFEVKPCWKMRVTLKGTFGGWIGLQVVTDGWAETLMPQFDFNNPDYDNPSCNDEDCNGVYVGCVPGELLEGLYGKTGWHFVGGTSGAGAEIVKVELVY